MWNWTSGYHSDEETLEVDWPRHSPRSLYCKNCFALEARRKTEEGPPQEHMAADGGEGNQGDGEDTVWSHQVYGKELTDVEAACCYPTCHLGIKGISEWVSEIGLKHQICVCDDIRRTDQCRIWINFSEGANFRPRGWGGNNLSFVEK